MKKLGRPPLPIAVHLRRGTFRKDRHGVRPPVQLPTRVAQAVEAAVTGAALVATIRSRWSVDDPIGFEHLRTLEIAVDRRRALDALLDGQDGLLVKLAAGEVSALSVSTILRAQQQCVEQIERTAALLDLEPPAAHEAAS